MMMMLNTLYTHTHTHRKFASFPRASGDTPVRPLTLQDTLANQETMLAGTSTAAARQDRPFQSDGGIIIDNTEEMGGLEEDEGGLLPPTYSSTKGVSK